MDIKGKIINVLGDSITAGHGTTGVRARFVSLLMSEYGAKLVRNYGISGTRIARQSCDGEGSAAYCDRYVKMEDDADIVIVFGGTNDYGHGDAEIGADGDCCPTTFRGACSLLMRGLIEKYPGAQLVFVTPTHRAGEDIPSTRAPHGLPLVRYVDIIKETARRYSIPVLDLYAMGGIVPDVEANKKRYCPDGLHPNDAGHILIAAKIAAFLGTL